MQVIVSSVSLHIVGNITNNLKLRLFYGIDLQANTLFLVCN